MIRIQKKSKNPDLQPTFGIKPSQAAKVCVSVPYSSNPDLADPGRNLNPDSGSGSRRTLNPDPSYFLTLSEQKLKLLHNYKTFSSKEVN